jgi:metallo-beta-lactamase family protein
VNEVFTRYPEAHKRVSVDSPETFGCHNLRVHVTSDESKELNHLSGTAIIIASSGMASGGRVLYHLHRHVSDPSATIIFAGHQVKGTLGREMIDGSQSIHLFGDRLTVRAHIDFFDAFSAHADRSELLRWIGTLQNKPRLYAVHGDHEAATALCAAVHERLGLDARVAEHGMTLPL